MQTITVDMTPGFRQPTIHYSQNDVGTTFAIDLRSRFGDTLPASPTVKIQATKPSGFGFSIEADSVVDSVATFTTVATMTDEAGRFLAELEVSDSGVVLYTANFYMEGEANPHPIGTTDGSQETIIPTLTLLVKRVEAAAASVLDMTVNATTLAAGSQATYSYDEATNTATFGIPQGEAGAGAAGVTASAYSSSKTYAVGDYVIHNSNLYRCTTAITTAEAFTAAHWTQVVLGDDVSDLKSDFNYIIDSFGELPLSYIDISGTQNDITITYDPKKRSYHFQGTASARTEVVLTKSFSLAAGNYIFDTGVSAVGNGFNIRLTTNGLANITGSDGKFSLSLGSTESNCAMRVIITNGSSVNVTITPTILTGDSLVVREEQFAVATGGETEAFYVSGKYLNANGVEADASGNTMGVLDNVSYKSKIVYSGCGYFSEVCGYHADGTVVKLIDSGSSVVYSNEEIIINDPDIVLVKAWSIDASASLSLKLVGLGERTTALENKVVFKEPKRNIGFIQSSGVVSDQSSGTNRYITINNVELGDQFVYTGRYYRSNAWGVVYGYYSDNTAVPLLYCGLYENKLITITDEDIVTVRAWADTSLHDFEFYKVDTIEATAKYTYEKVAQLSNDLKVVVDINGNGDFTDINSALTFIKSAYDVNNKPIELYIRNGVYNVNPTATGNYYAIDKGANKISIRGESREHTIIRCTCTSTLQGIALNIGGECTVENLTIENLADASYTPETILTDGEHRPYCIHNDEAANDESAKYYTTVRNCKLYSECSCPLGAGMHHNQVQRYENVEFIYADDAVIQQQGALYLHGPNDASYVPIGAEIVDCVAVSHNSRPAISMGNVSGMMTWAQMSATFIRNVTYSHGSSEVALATGMNITPYSKSNSNSELDA